MLPGDEDRQRPWLAHLDERGGLAAITAGDIRAALLESQALPVASLHRDDPRGERAARLRLDENRQKASRTCPESGSWARP